MKKAVWAYAWAGVNTMCMQVQSARAIGCAHAIVLVLTRPQSLAHSVKILKQG